LKVDACRAGSPTYFTPHRVESPARSRGFWTCTHFLGQFYAAHLRKTGRAWGLAVDFSPRRVELLGRAGNLTRFMVPQKEGRHE